MEKCCEHKCGDAPRIVVGSLFQREDITRPLLAVSNPKDPKVFKGNYTTAGEKFGDWVFDHCSNMWLRAMVRQIVNRYRRAAADRGRAYGFDIDTYLKDWR